MFAHVNCPGPPGAGPFVTKNSQLLKSSQVTMYRFRYTVLTYMTNEAHESLVIILWSLAMGGENQAVQFKRKQRNMGGGIQFSDACNWNCVCFSIRPTRWPSTRCRGSMPCCTTEPRLEHLTSRRPWWRSSRVWGVQEPTSSYHTTRRRSSSGLANNDIMCKATSMDWIIRKIHLTMLICLNSVPGPKHDMRYFTNDTCHMVILSFSVKLPQTYRMCIDPVDIRYKI